MSNLEINLFGEFRVRRGGELIGSEEWGGQKTRALLKLLLTRPGRAFSRDEISEALWPGFSPQAADRRLRTTVSLLRRALEPDLERGSDSRYVLSRRPGYAFDERADCRVDAWEFDERRKRAEADREAERLDQAVREYRAALDLVEGEFLTEDPYEDWAMEAREEWRERHLSTLAGLAECLARKGRYTEAIEAVNRALELDRYREGLHRGLMLYRYCAGEQALALRAYEEYAERLREELGATPSPELTRLKELMEARDVPGVNEGRRRYPRPRRPLRFPYSLSRTHFAGREGEYALLAERLREAAGGRGGAVAVEGEAGVGKTRLAEEFLGYAGSRGFRVFSGRCYERELGPPLEPIMYALDPVTDVKEMLSGLPHPGAGEPGYWREDEPYERVRVYGALTGELAGRSRGGGREGLVLFVDDVQWADPATLEFLSYLAKRIQRERVVLVLAYRREDASLISDHLDHLAGRRAMTVLSLDRLSPRDVTEIVARMSSRDFDELSSLANFLYRETEGNPFYVVEYLRWLIESGAVRIDARRRIGALERDLPREGALPSGVRALIGARLGGMDDEARELLRAAAVLGRTFDLGLLRRITGSGEAETLCTVEPLMDSGLVIEAPAGGEYQFSHDKLRQALYEDIAGPRRRELHLRVAEALERAGGEPAELAHHYLRAEEWRPALENLVRAAKKAEEGYAWETALEIYARALEAVEKLPDSAEAKFGLMGARERLLEHVNRREERAETVARMFELASRLGDRARMAEVHVRRIGVLASLSDPGGAAEAGREAVAIFRELEDEAAEARAHRELGYVLWTSGNYAGALKANFRALRIHRALGDRRAEAGAAGNIARIYRGMKNHERALRWAEEAARIDRELGDRLGETIRVNAIAGIHRERGELEAALSLHLKTFPPLIELGAKNLLVPQHSACGTLCLDLGDPEKALEHFRAAARLGREMGYTRDEGYSMLSVGVSLERLGDPAGAAEAYRKAIELLQTAHEESGKPEELLRKADALSLLAAVLRHSLGEPAEALGAYEAAARVYREFGDDRRLRKLLGDLGGLRWLTVDPEGAARDYGQALELAREQDETVSEAAALMSLSVVHRDLGRLKESVRCGRAALRLLEDLSDPQAEAYVLSSLAASYERSGHYPSALSCLRRSLHLRRKTGDERGEIGVLNDLARVYGELGDAGRAREAAAEAARKEGAGGSMDLVQHGRRS